MKFTIHPDVLSLAPRLEREWAERLERLYASGVPLAVESSATEERDENAGPAFRTVEEYDARQDAIREQLQALDQDWAGQIMPDNQKSRWNALNSELEENEQIIDELRTRQERLAQLSGRETAREHTSGAFNTPRPRNTDIWDVWAVRRDARGPEDEVRMLRDNAMRAVERSHFPHPDVDDDGAKGHIESLMARFESLDQSSSAGIGEGNLSEFTRLILTTGNPVYKRAFGKQVMGRALNPEEQRALATATTAGGFAVPFSLDPTIIPTSNLSVNPFRAVARVETIATTTWQGITSAGVTATRRSEAAQTSDAAPTLAQPTATPTRVDAFVPYSIEIGQDWGALEAEMARLIQDAKDDEEASSFTNGSGTPPAPQGIVTGATTVVTGAGTGTFALADVYSVYNALPPRFKPRAQWVANEAVYNLVRQFDTQGGASIWIDNLQEPTGGQAVPRPGGLGRRLLGRPAWEDSAMTGTVATNGILAVLGDWRYFIIVDRIGMQVELIPHLFGTTQLPTGQRGLFAFWRNTSVVVSANAFRALKVR